jgi:acetolactate synthase regulatory subunit
MEDRCHVIAKAPIAAGTREPAADCRYGSGPHQREPRDRRSGVREDEVNGVHALRFFTPDPLDHCARALDVVRRMGFDLVSVSARPTPGASFLVHMNFVPFGEMPPRVLADRVSRFVGVSGVELDAE